MASSTSPCSRRQIKQRQKHAQRNSTHEYTEHDQDHGFDNTGQRFHHHFILFVHEVGHVEKKRSNLSTSFAVSKCLVDIGGGTSDLAVFTEGEIYYTAVVPVGGAHVTNDVSEGLKVGYQEAERLKTESGSAVVERVTEDEVITLQQMGRDEERKLRRRALVQIIEPRMQEMFEMILEELDRAECLDKIPFGIVISGGGSQLRDCTEVAHSVLGLPVRIGKPHGVKGLTETLEHPRYATAVGLLKYAAKQKAVEQLTEQIRKPRKVGGLQGLWAKILEMLGI